MGLLPQYFLDTVVAIGRPNDGPNGTTFWMATGFIYGHVLRRDGQDNIDVNTYLVTNRHVFKDEHLVQVRFNSRGDTSSEELTLDLDKVAESGDLLFHPEENVDLAIANLNLRLLRERGLDANFFTSNADTASDDDLREYGISEGDDAYLLGFPLQLVDDDRNHVIVRRASIASIRRYLAGKADDILIDCMNFPGNSGGPVILQPQSHMAMMCPVGSNPPQVPQPVPPLLLGVIKSYHIYDAPIEGDPDAETTTYAAENSGLAYMEPAQHLIDLVEIAQKSGKGTNELLRVKPNHP